ncbi:NUDIX domain-containing protein [Rhodoferax sp.]|uniref:NUDIX hydrolase n=1 Tax=Rhodoferax sp. TaxID=50421 RepID=UPI0025F44DD9|nr:NUDIX domain-containing protein [Rhodoferax sp.]
MSVPPWLAQLRADADQPPLRPRAPLWAGRAQVGSVEPEFIRKIELQRIPYLHRLLLKIEQNGKAGWQLQGDPTNSLAHLAHALRDAGLAAAWRDEQLAVSDAEGQAFATVERAVVRALGITTHAVHLVGAAPDGRVWVQQRALTKPNDPGLWDTLVGGMVSAADNLDTALERETWEEAGLRLPTLQALRPGGQLTTRRPSTDSGGAGYVVEHIHWYACTLPAGLEPQNQDGEVQGFALLTPALLVQQLEEGAFTDDAALILAGYLGLG